MGGRQCSLGGAPTLILPGVKKRSLGFVFRRVGANLETDFSIFGTMCLRTWHVPTIVKDPGETKGSHVCVHSCVCVYVCVFMCMFICVHVYVCVLVFVCFQFFIVLFTFGFGSDQTNKTHRCAFS